MKDCERVKAMPLKDDPDPGHAAIEALVCQQFYEEPDTIVDRTKGRSIRIKNSGRVILSVIKMLDEKLRDIKIEEQSIHAHSETLAALFRVDHAVVWESIQSSMGAVGTCEYGDEEQSRVMTYTFLLGATLEALQRKVVNSIITEFLHEMKEDDRAKVESLLYAEYPFQFSLLVNLSMLCEMAHVVDINIDEYPKKKMFSVLLQFAMKKAKPENAPSS